MHAELADSEPLFQGGDTGEVPVSFWSQHFHHSLNTSSCFMCGSVSDTLFNLYSLQITYMVFL